MAFFEIEFPRHIAYKRVGGPGFSTTVNTGFSGQEQRNKNWSAARGKWTVSLLTPPADQLGATTLQGYVDLLNAFFLNVSGQGDSFRLKDHLDYQATGQTLGTGNGTLATFQLIKAYSIGGRTYTRSITKPITSSVTDYQGNALSNTVKLYLNGVLQGSGWSVDYTTGIVTFSSAPGSGVVVSADFQFHYPVRFGADYLGLQVEESNIAGGQPIISLNSMELLEVRPPNY